MTRLTDLALIFSFSEVLDTCHKQKTRHYTPGARKLREGEFISANETEGFLISECLVKLH